MPAPSDRDLASIAEARTLARNAHAAQARLAEYSQAQIDAIVDAMAAAVTPEAEALARLAVEETTFGVVADKVQKNLFSSERVYEFIRPMKTVGVVNRIEDRKVIEIAEPFGVVAAIVPSTNPTSTAIYKILIAIKARCAIVISPHPVRGAMHHPRRRDHGRRRGDGRRAGWRDRLDDHGDDRGDAGADEAARGRGDPGDRRDGPRARGVQRRQAGVRRRTRQRAVLHRIVGRSRRRPPPTSCIGKCFDHGVLCSSPNSVVVDDAVAEEVRRQFQTQGAYFLSPAETDAVGRVLVSPQRLPQPALVGKPATLIAEKAGITVPHGTRALIAPLAGRRSRLPAVDRKAVPGPVVSTWCGTGGRAASAARRFCDTAGWATRCPSTRATSR